MTAKGRPEFALFLKLCAKHGLRDVVQEYKFHPTRKWRFDFCWPASLCALECDGGVWTGGRHTRGLGYVKDMEKLNEAARLGWRVVRVTPSQLPLMSTIQLILDLKALSTKETGTRAPERA